MPSARPVPSSGQKAHQGMPEWTLMRLRTALRAANAARCKRNARTIPRLETWVACCTSAANPGSELCGRGGSPVACVSIVGLRCAWRRHAGICPRDLQYAPAVAQPQGHDEHLQHLVTGAGVGMKAVQREVD